MPCFSQSAQFKRGTTASWLGRFTDANDLPINLTGNVITSQLRRTNRELVAELTVTLLDQVTNTGQFILSGDSSEWPIASLLIDVRREVGGVVAYTDTGRIDIVEEVTANV